MGWSATLVSNNEVSFVELKEIVENLPKELRNIFLSENKIPFNSWGWSAATDISLPVCNELRISGSYGISGDKAEVMANYLKGKLEERGHSIRINFNW